MPEDARGRYLRVIKKEIFTCSETSHKDFKLDVVTLFDELGRTKKYRTHPAAYVRSSKSPTKATLQSPGITEDKIPEKIEK